MRKLTRKAKKSSIKLPYNANSDEYIPRASTTQVIGDIISIHVPDYQWHEKNKKKYHDQQEPGSIDDDIVFRKFYQQASTIQKVSQAILDIDLENIIPGLYNDNGKRNRTSSHELARRLGYTLKNVGGVNIENIDDLSDNYAQLSRLNKQVGAQVITCARGSDTRKKQWESIIQHQLFGGKKPYLSDGIARTVRPNPSRASKVIDYTQTDKQYGYIHSRDDETITYDLLCRDEWVRMTILIPVHLRGAKTYSLPKIVFSSTTNEMSIVITAKFEPVRFKISERYAIGVDVGITHYVTYVVYDRVENRVVERGRLSNYLDKELHDKIRVTRQQIADIQVKLEILRCARDDQGRIPWNVKFQIDRLEQDVAEQRIALSRKRDMLSRQAAGELKNISIKYGNAPVVHENLSWVGNTMEHGRWNCGAFFTRLWESLEIIGGMSFKVSAYKTSQTCSECGNQYKQGLNGTGLQFHKGDSSTNRECYCELCGYREDRDINAAINIVKRAFDIIDEIVEEQVSQGIVDEQSGVREFSRGHSPLWHRERQRKKALERSRRNSPSKQNKRKKRHRKRYRTVSRMSRPPRSAKVLKDVLPIIQEKRCEKAFVKLLCPLQFKSLLGLCGELNSSAQSIFMRPIHDYFVQNALK